MNTPKVNWVSHFKIPLLITGVYLIIFFIQYIGPFQPGDGGVKHLQLMDLVSQNFTSLSCVYTGREIDPEFRYLRLLHDGWMMYVKDGQCYHYFPFYFAFLQAPFYLLFGNAGEYFVPVISGILTIWLFWFWSGKLGLTDQLKKMFIFSLAFATAISHYSVSISEHTFVCLFVSVSLYLTWDSFEKEKKIGLVFAGFLLAVGTLFRQETAIIAAILAISMVIVYKRKGFINGTIFSLSFLIFTAIHLFINYQVLGLLLGGRSIQQSSERASLSISENLLMLLEILFYGRFSVGLFLATPLLLLPIYYFRSVLQWPKSLKILLLTCILFTITLPMVSVTYQGVNWGPRFLLSLSPFLMLTVFLTIHFREVNEKLFFGKRLKLVVFAGILYSTVAIFLAHILLYKTYVHVKQGNEVIEKFSTDVIIYRTSFLSYSGISTHIKKMHFIVYKDADFKPLIERLKKAGIKKITVVYATQYLTKDPELVPEDVKNLLKSDLKVPFEDFRIQNFSIL